MRTVSDKYLHIEEALVATRILQQLDTFGYQATVSKTKLGSSRSMVTIRIPSLFTQDFGGITPLIKVFNSHDGSSAFKLQVGFERLVCSNGCTIMESQFSERIIHRKGNTAEEALAALPEIVRKAIQYITIDLLPFFARLQNTSVTPSQMKFIVKELRIPKTVKARALEAVTNNKIRPTWDQNNSLFSLYNFVNQFTREAGRSTTNSQERVERHLLEDIVSLAKVA
jgi:hypothetical protein